MGRDVLRSGFGCGPRIYDLSGRRIYSYDIWDVVSRVRDMKEGGSPHREMKKLTKILLAIVTILPLTYMVFFFVVVSMLFAFFLFGGTSERDYLFGVLTVLVPLHLGTIVLILALGVFYIHHLFENDRINQDKKVLWAVVLFMGNMISMPVYWYLYVWRNQLSDPRSDCRSS